MGWFEQNAPQQHSGQPAIGFTEQGQPIYGTPRPVNTTPANADPNRAYLLGGGTAATPALPTQQPQVTLGNTGDPAGNTGITGGMSGSLSGGGGGDYEATFNQLFPGDTLSPQELAAKESQLPQGWRLLGPNAAGQRTKIQLPDGRVIDAIQGAGSGANKKHFMVTGGGGAAGASGLPPGFQVGSFTGGGQYPLSSVMGTGLAAPWTTPFNAPDPNSVTNDKALQWQMGRGMEAIQRSAAAKGTLLTGGTLKALDAFGQGLGSTYYNDVYNRKLGEYKMAHDIYEGNQSNLYDRLFNVAGMGQKAAANLSSDAGTYGSNAGNTMLGQGNAAASGTAAGGAAYGNAVQNIGNIAASSYQATHQPNTYQQPGYNPNWTMAQPDYGNG